jgi:hypothetical protein
MFEGAWQPIAEFYRTHLLCSEMTQYNFEPFDPDEPPETVTIALRCPGCGAVENRTFATKTFFTEPSRRMMVTDRDEWVRQVDLYLHESGDKPKA